MSDTYHHEPPYTIGVIVGSIAEASINRRLAKALMALAPEQLECSFIEIRDLPLYDYGLDDDFPQVATDFKQAIADSDAILIVTPEYNRSIPGALKNAIDWASRPSGQNVFNRKPVGIIGTSPSGIGTAVGQQHLKTIINYCQSPLYTEMEAYVQWKDGLVDDDGTVTVDSTKQFLTQYIHGFDRFVQRVLTVVPKG